MRGKVWFTSREETGQVARDLVCSHPAVFILVDEHTRECCLPELCRLFPFFREAAVIVTPAGEAHKNLERCRSVWLSLTDAKAGRDALLVNLGGGVVCDLGGFAAAVYKRGISFLHIPTTLLAMADAAIGGKTGIDLGPLKNQLGLFALPEAVLVHPPFLKTLPVRELVSGYAEIIKIAFTSDPDLFRILVSSGKPDATLPEDLIRRAVALKEQIVARDFHDIGLRKTLNFGHTTGHALESFCLSAGKPVLHGEAVAAGMICESYLSLQEGLIPTSRLDAITRLVTGIYPPVPYTFGDIPAILGYMEHDKKNKAGGVHFSLPAEAGGTLDRTVPPALREEALQHYLQLVHG